MARVEERAAAAAGRVLAGAGRDDVPVRAEGHVAAPEVLLVVAEDVVAELDPIIGATVVVAVNADDAAVGVSIADLLVVLRAERHRVAVRRERDGVAGLLAVLDALDPGAELDPAGARAVLEHLDLALVVEAELGLADG